MSDVEKFWEGVAAKFGDNRKWSDLNLEQQQVLIRGINHILAVLHRVV